MSENLAAPEAIIFDWDGTLVDCWPSIHAALNATLTAMGHEPWTYEETLSRVRKSMRDSFPELFGNRWEEAGEIFYEHVEAHHLDGTTVLEGAPELLQLAHERGYYVGIVSNKQGPLLRAEINHLGWQPMIRQAVGAGDATEDKPARNPMDLVLQDSDITAGPSVWYVGDTGIDMEFAANCGCLGLLIHANTANMDEIGEFPPLRHFKSRHALIEEITLLK